MIFIFLSCENAHDSKKFSRENSKPLCESHILTHEGRPCLQ